MQARSDILLVAVNARYGHCSFAARTLLANLGDWRARALLLEADMDILPMQLASDIVERSPRMVSFSVYLWNAQTIRDTVMILRRVAPALRIVLGGPEIAKENAQEWSPFSDALVVGEGESALRQLCSRYLNENPASQTPSGIAEIITTQPEDTATLTLPYDLYSSEDLAHRSLFVESSRGCPCSCVYCTSGNTGLRLIPLERLLPALDELLNRGARNFRFLDRSFNINEAHACCILDFFLARHPQRLSLHFEIFPCRLGESLRERIHAFPPGVLHLEVGIQTLNPVVARQIGRSLDTGVALETTRFLACEARATVHVDLIFGLPGEDEASLGRGFDTLVRTIHPPELQVNILKRLPGTLLASDARFAGLVFSPCAPYELLASDRLDFQAVTRLQRFARCWELVHNRGKFPRVNDALLKRGGDSPFACYMKLAVFIQSEEGRLHAIGADRLGGYLARFLVHTCGLSEAEAHSLMIADRQSPDGCDAATRA